MKKHITCIATTALIGLLTTSCDRPSEKEEAGPTSAGPLRVVAVNEPLAYFARRIGGDPVEADCPAPPDGDPAYWEPDDEDLQRIQQADLILLNGAGYAHWLDTASLPESKMVDTSAAFGDRLIALDGETTHSHGPEGDHEHGGMAFTTWLDFDLARQHADAVRAALAGKLDVRQAALEAGHDALVADLQALDDGFKQWGKTAGGAPLLGSHPVYQYLSRAYGLNLRSVHWEPDAMPAEEDWKALAALLESHPARWMLWEGEPLPETTRRLQALGVKCVVVDPCGAPPPEEDFLAAMRSNLEALQSIQPAP